MSDLPDIPVEYLLICSNASLEDFRLSRMNHVANVRKQVMALIDEWVKESTAADVAAWIEENRNKLREAIELEAHQEKFDFARPPQVLRH